MNYFSVPATLFSAIRWSLFREGGFLGRVLDEWTGDSQEFLHTKLPKLIVIAILALILSRVLRRTMRPC